MSLLNFTFYFFCTLVAGSAITLLFVKNIFHAALALLSCLLGIAALFILCMAEFSAVAQILLYAGGVVVLLIFGIMLTNKSGAQPIAIGNTGIFGGVLVGGSLFFLLLFFVNKSIFILPIQKPSAESNTIKTIGIELLTDYVLPFEITGILLLAVLAGAATIAGYKPSKN
jgi:NADH-quinone oxidoreductase subunit J